MPHYLRVWLMFLSNGLTRELTFRGNFVITILTRMFWFAAQLTLFEIIYRNVPAINDWSRQEYFAFMATGMLINALVEAFFMPNCANFSELIRTGNLDFALLKPIDTQFLISFEKMDLAMFNQILLSLALLAYALIGIGRPITAWQVGLYWLYIGVGVAFFYSMMIMLASTSIWLGRNQTLYDFWFYITIFARYPRSIYSGVNSAAWELGEMIQFGFSYLLPILLVVTVPAEVLVKPFVGWTFPLIALSSAVVGMLLARCVFQQALKSYRSASS
jgi:viologen exporter family transport system permease protein